LNDFNLGITLSLMGISITFLALGALILLIVLLRALFPPKIPDAAEESNPEVDPVKSAVAIAAAWWYLRNKKASSLGQVLEQPPGNWRHPSR
jgi:Na+-transporting methylmalonyl-CoA/oxaloacetate decarboxylase gamma subunit